MSNVSTRLRREHMPALRLSISRLKSGWAVTAENKIDKMLLPGSQDLPSSSKAGKIAGNWFEVWDKNKNIIYRRQIDMPDMLESHGDKREVSRQAVKPELVPPIEIIVPHLKQDMLVLLYSTIDHRTGKHMANIGAKQVIPFAMFLRTENN